MPKAAVIYGADTDRAAFATRVGVLQRRLNQKKDSTWELVPIYWPRVAANVGRIVDSLKDSYPEPPPWPERDDGDGEIEIHGGTVIVVTVQPDGTTFEPTPMMARLIWEVRRLGLAKVAGPLADALGYGHDYDDIRRYVVKQIREQVGEPANVIAHSGGGMIAVDLAAERLLTMKGLVTFGSLSAFLHILAPGRLGKLRPYEPKPPIKVSLNGIDRWTNLYSHYDFAAFAAGKVFKLARGVADRGSQIGTTTRDPGRGRPRRVLGEPRPDRGDQGHLPREAGLGAAAVPRRAGDDHRTRRSLSTVCGSFAARASCSGSREGVEHLGQLGVVAAAVEGAVLRARHEQPPPRGRS